MADGTPNYWSRGALALIGAVLVGAVVWVNRAYIFQDDVTVQGGLNVVGNAQVGGTLHVTGTTTLPGQVNLGNTFLNGVTQAGQVTVVTSSGNVGSIHMPLPASTYAGPNEFRMKTWYTGADGPEMMIGYNIDPTPASPWQQRDATKQSMGWMLEMHYDPGSGFVGEQHSFAIAPGQTKSIWPDYFSWKESTEHITRSFHCGDTHQWYDGNPNAGPGTVLLAELSTTVFTMNVPVTQGKGVNRGLYLSWESATTPTVHPDGTALTGGERVLISTGGTTGQWWVYDAVIAKWVSEQRYALSAEHLNLSANGAAWLTCADAATYDYWIDELESFALITTTNDANSYWAMTVNLKPSNSTPCNTNTSALVADTWTAFPAATFPGAHYWDMSAQKAIYITINKAGATGTPGPLDCQPVLKYRRVLR